MKVGAYLIRQEFTLIGRDKCALSVKEAQEYAEQNNMLFMEIAKTADNTTQVFEVLCPISPSPKDDRATTMPKHYHPDGKKEERTTPPSTSPAPRRSATCRFLSQSSGNYAFSRVCFPGSRRWWKGKQKTYYSTTT